MIKYNNILTNEDDINEVSNILNSSNWGFNGHSGTNLSKKFWFMQLIQNDFFNGYFTDKIKNLIRHDFQLEKLYANGQTFSLDSEWHIDSSEDKRYTFLYYANPIWNPSWGGETLFHTGDGQIQYVYPEPNSGIFFASNLYHYGRSPTKECPCLRTTVAFKFKLLD